MKNLRSFTGLVVAGLLAGASLVGCASEEATPSESVNKKVADLPILNTDASYSIDVDNPKATVGDADYVFVGKVSKIVDTEYQDVVTVETESGQKEVSDPYTNLRISVVENIKGDLKLNDPIPAQKSGGVTEDGTAIVLPDADVLPEEGMSYVFLAYAQEDGSLLISGPNSNVQLEEASKGLSLSGLKREAQEASVVQKYEDAYRHQIETDRDRSVADESLID